MVLVLAEEASVVGELRESGNNNGGSMIDPSMMDPQVVVAMKQAGFDHVDDLNHNGKLDVQDVALMKIASSNVVTTPVAAPVQ